VWSEGRLVPAIALYTAVLLPVGSAGLSGEATVWEGRLAVQKTIGRIFRVGVNAGVEGTFPDAGSSRVALPLAGSVGVRLFGLVDVFGEVFGKFELDDDTAPPFTGRMGVAVRALDRLVFDIAVDIGISNSAPDLGVQAGITWSIADLH
jgi:hypothetical protein